MLIYLFSCLIISLQFQDNKTKKNDDIIIIFIIIVVRNCHSKQMRLS